MAITQLAEQVSLHTNKIVGKISCCYFFSTRLLPLKMSIILILKTI